MRKIKILWLVSFQTIHQQLKMLHCHSWNVGEKPSLKFNCFQSISRCFDHFGATMPCTCFKSCHFFFYSFYSFTIPFINLFLFRFFVAGCIRYSLVLHFVSNQICLNFHLFNINCLGNASHGFLWFDSFLRFPSFKFN